MVGNQDTLCEACGVGGAKMCAGVQQNACIDMLCGTMGRRTHGPCEWVGDGPAAQRVDPHNCESGQASPPPRCTNLCIHGLPLTRTSAVAYRTS